MGLPHVLAYLKPGNVNLVSGCSHDSRSNLHDRFLTALKAQRPEVVAELEAQKESRRQKAEEQHKLSALFTTTGGRGEGSEKASGSSSATFSFGFQ